MQQPAAIAASPPAKTGLGRLALPEEIAAWDIDVRPDGKGLPKGRGSVKQGEDLYMAQCASCHGEFGEGVGRWPVLAGGHGSLKGEGPEKTIGSFWPFISTTFDYLNDQVKDDFELSSENFAKVKLPNEAAFHDDDRETAERHFWRQDPCMSNCTATQPKVTMRARVLDVTPEAKTAPKVD
jgi:cytochrome c